MTTAVATRPMDSLKALLESAKPSIQSLLPSHMKADHVIRTALLCVSKTPKLLECTPMSVLQAVASSAELGLEAGSPLGHAYLVPFKNKRGAMECQLIVGYKGYIDLARRSGHVLSIEARVVHDKDEFTVAYGTDTPITHHPFLKGDPGPVYCAYAIAQLKDSWPVVEVMTMAQLDGIRKRSKAKDDGPWVTDPEEMYRKTVVRRIQKYLPLSSEMAKALDADREAIDIETEEVLDANFDVLMDPQPVNGNVAAETQPEGETADPHTPSQPTDQPTNQAATPPGEVDPSASSAIKGQLTAQLCAARDRNDQEALAAIGGQIAKSAHQLTSADLKALQSTHEMCLTVVDKRTKKK